jgi:hypothetical protein
MDIHVVHVHSEAYVINGWEMINMKDNNNGFYFSEEFGFKPKTKKSSDKKKEDKKKDGKKENNKKQKD